MNDQHTYNSDNYRSMNVVYHYGCNKSTVCDLLPVGVYKHRFAAADVKMVGKKMLCTLHQSEMFSAASPTPKLMLCLLLPQQGPFQ